MLRNAASKVMWVGRATVFLIGLAVILALVFGVASTVSAHTGNKGFFHLGHKNVSKAVSTLVKQGPGPALNLVVQSGQPPLNVNSTGKVPRLNADMVDGKHANAFLPRNGKAADADKLDGHDSTAFFGGELPAGNTIRGVYAVGWTPGAANEFQHGAVNFGFALASAPTPHFIAQGSQPPTACPGTPENPQAAPGNLCVYERVGINLASRQICDPAITTCGVANRSGAQIRLISNAASIFSGSRGSWAVSAPSAQQQSAATAQQALQESQSDISAPDGMRGAQQ